MKELFFPVTRREAERQGVQYSSEKNRNARFPSQLRELREESGLSQAGLSQKLGVSKSTIGLWETGDTLPDAKAIRDIADYFNVSSDYLLGRTNVKTSNMDLRRACEFFGLSEEAGEAIHNFYGTATMDGDSRVRMLNWIFEKIIICPAFMLVWTDLYQLLLFYSDVYNNFESEQSEGQLHRISNTTITDKDIINARILSAETNFRTVISKLMNQAKTKEYAQLKEMIISEQAAKAQEKNGE